jgi:hypothetical protein
MAREKTSDIKLYKLISKVSTSRDVTMGYVLYQSEVIRTNTEINYHITIIPIIRQDADGTPIPEVDTSNPASAANQFKRENKLSATVDLVSRTVRFPHINRFKVQKYYRGYGLGSHAMNELAAYLKHTYPEFEVEPVSFSFDAKRGDGEDRDAFFTFMERYGFWFKFDGDNNNSGILNIERAEMLKTTIKKDTFQEIEISSFVKGLFRERSELRDEIGRIRAEFKQQNTVFNRFEKDQAITFLTNVIAALCIVILILLFT